MPVPPRGTPLRRSALAHDPTVFKTLHEVGLECFAKMKHDVASTLRICKQQKLNACSVAVGVSLEARAD